MHDENDRTPGLTSHSGGRMTEEEWTARGQGQPAPEQADDDNTESASAGLAPKGTTPYTTEDPRYAEVRTISWKGESW